MSGLPMRPTKLLLPYLLVLFSAPGLATAAPDSFAQAIPPAEVGPAGPLGPLAGQPVGTAQLSGKMAQTQPLSSGLPASGRAVRLHPSESKAVRFPGRWVDLMVHAGASIPGGNFYHDGRTAATYGAGIGKDVLFGRHLTLRGTLAYGYARYPAKSPHLAGHIGLHSATLRLDALVGGGVARPFVGGGVGLYPWSGRITNRADGQQHARVSNEFGGLVVVGVDVRLSRSWSLAPEVSWRRLTGKFSDMLWGAEVAARWRL